MPKNKYEFYSMISGCLWGAVAYYLGHGLMQPFIWGGVVASPIIGLFIGRLFSQFMRDEPRFLWFFPILNLFIASSLFGLACGYTKIFMNLPQANGAAVIELVLMCPAGAAMYITFLWPLSLANHLVLKRYG